MTDSCSYHLKKGDSVQWSEGNRQYDIFCGTDRLWKSRGITTHAVPIIAPGIINESRLKELADNRFIAIIPVIIAGVALKP